MPPTVDTLEPRDEIALVELWMSIWRYRRVIVLVTVTATLVAGAWTWSLPNQYTVVAKIQPGSAQLIAALEASDVHARIASAFDLRQVLGELDDRSTLRTMKEVVAFSVDKRDGLLNVAVTLPDPELAARVANAYFPLVSELVAARLLTQEALARKGLEIQAVKVNDALSALEERYSSVGYQFTAQQQFSMQITGDLRAEAALATGDSQNALPAVLRMQELIANIERISVRPSSPASVGKAASVDRYLAQQMYQDLAFYRSLGSKLLRQADMAREHERLAIRLIAPAQVSLEKSKPARFQRIALTFLVTLFVAMLSALVADYLHAATRHKPTHEPLCD